MIEPHKPYRPNSQDRKASHPFPKTLVVQNPTIPQRKTETQAPKAGAPRRNNNRRPNRPMDRPKRTPFTHTRKGGSSLNIPPVEEGVLRIIPIGGVEQVGQNMTALEYGNDIIIIDAGIEFSDEDTPGVDYIIPNTKYLEDRKEKIRGIFITHGHLDHIGALPYVIEKLGNAPIYSRQFGALMISKRQEEFPHLPKINMNIVGGDDVIRISENFVIRTFAISHTIPDSMGFLIGTPLGEIAFIEDVRVDNINGIPTEEEVEQYSRFKDRNILLLTMDSTSIEKPGFSLSEQTVAQNIEKIIRDVSGRIIIATFASQVERIASMISSAEKYGKKVVIEGRSMKSNVEIAKLLGLIKNKNIIPIEEINDYPPNKIMMIVTGGQGEEFSALDRISSRTHRYVVLTKNDTVLLSSSIIPGNVTSITKLKDKLYRSEAKIITYLDSDVHASGHGNRDELKWIHQHIKYRFFMPLHGYHYMLCQHAELSATLGTPRENIVIPDNGSLVEIYDGGKKIRVRKEKAPADVVTVDGLNIGDTQEFVIRDRKMLAQDGMFVIMVLIDGQTGKLRKSPDLISRGFVYLKENQTLLHEARGLIKRTIEQNTAGLKPINYDYLKEAVSDTVSKFLFQKTAKRPLVIPVILNT